MMTPEDVCPDLSEWPNSWAEVQKDVAYGHALLDVIRPFMVYLIYRGLKLKTLRRHFDNLWFLGGEIIRAVSTDDQYAVAPEEILRSSIDDDGGPFCRHLDSEIQEQSFDATCRLLHKHLQKTETG